MELTLAHVDAGEQAERRPGAPITSAGLHGMFIGIWVVIHLQIDFAHAVVEQVVLSVQLITA